MKTIEYSPNGQAVPDHAAESLVRSFLKGPDERLVVSTDNVVHAARCLVVEGEHPYTDLRFEFEGEFIPVQKTGALPKWPYKFCDYSDRWLDRLLSSRTSL